MTNHGCDLAKYYRVVRKYFAMSWNMSWNGIFHDMAKYFATSFNNIQVAKKY
jgi:hypothetical protein